MRFKLQSQVAVSKQAVRFKLKSTDFIDTQVYDLLDKLFYIQSSLTRSD